MPDDGIFDVKDAHKLDGPARLKELRPWELLNELAGIAIGNTCVDFGSGTGTFTIPMAEMAGPEGAVFAVDNSLEMLAHIEAKNPPENLRLVHKNVTRTGLVAGSADVCLAAFILHEISPPEDFIREAVRLLKRGGRLIIIEWAPGLEKPGPPAEVRISKEEITRLFTRNGLTLSSFTQWSRNYYVAVGKTAF